MAEANSSILIVDDDADDRAAVERALRSIGGEIHSIKDPHEVIPSVLKTRPDVVILDALLPGLSGFDLCKQIKENPELKTTQVLILTGVYLRQQYRKEATDQFKADGFLTKPFRPPELQRVVVQLVAKKTRLPQSGFLKRIGLPVSSGGKKKGLWGRLFGKEEPETIRIAPVAREAANPSAEAVEVAERPSPGGGGKTPSKGPATETPASQLSETAASQASETKQKPAPTLLPPPASSKPIEEAPPAKVAEPVEEPPSSGTSEPAAESDSTPPVSPAEPEEDQVAENQPAAVPESAKPSGTESPAEVDSRPPESARVEALPPEEPPLPLEEGPEPPSEEAEGVSATAREAVAEAAESVASAESTAASPVSEPERETAPVPGKTEAPSEPPSPEPAATEDVAWATPVPEVPSAAERPEAAPEPGPAPEPLAESAPRTIAYRVPEPESAPETIAYRMREPVAESSSVSEPVPEALENSTDAAEPSASSLLDAPPPIEAEAVTWILAESRTQELSLDEAAARAARPRGKKEEAAGESPEPEGLAAEGSRAKSQVAEPSGAQAPAAEASQPEALVTEASQDAPMEEASGAEAPVGEPPRLEVAAAEAKEDAPSAAVPVAAVGTAPDEDSKEPAAETQPTPEPPEPVQATEPQRAPQSEAAERPKLAEPVSSVAATTAAAEETASSSHAPTVQRPRLRIGDVPIYEEADFSTELKRELSKCKRVDRPLTLILIRVGDLSQIVELFGKEYREPVLWHVAEQAMACLREVDLVGMMSSRNLVAMTAFASDRYGGGRIVSRMRQALTKKPFRVGEELPPIIPVLEFGMAAFPEDGNESATLIERAEKELSSRD